MKIVSVCLYISAIAYIVIGGYYTKAGLSYALILGLVLSLLAIWNAKSIEAQSSRAAWIGVFFMAALTGTHLFPLGLIGLYGAYRDRKAWSAWE